MKNDFNDRILGEVAHRPWPMPHTPWIMTQTWHDLLFAHWPVEAAVLRSKIPAAIALDLFDGRAWLGLIPFRMSNVAPRAVPALPWLSAFPELNVRTYVRIGDRPGVFFFSLDASNPSAVWTARTFFHLPYFTASMQVGERSGAVEYSSRRVTKRSGGAELVAAYRPSGSPFQAEPGTLDYFLTERYCLYTVDRQSRPLRLEIHHPPWLLQRADAEIEINTMAAAAGIELPSERPLLHFARRQDMVAFPIRRVGVPTFSQARHETHQRL